MRLLALTFAALAVAVWWRPLPTLDQSLVLLMLAAAMLSIRSAWKRLDRAHDAVMEAKRILHDAREEEVN
jgi:hypothetical protein